MASHAKRILAELRHDHRNMAILLNLLQQEIEHVDHDDESADFELMQEIMRYMTLYPDTTHHPKEDLIYAAMQSTHPDQAVGLDAVEDDHREIAAFSKRLLSDIKAVVAGEFVTRERVVSDAEEYVRRLRKHMVWEEEDLFVRADSMLDDLDIDDSRFDLKDPLFGDQRDASFTMLGESVESKSE